MKKNNLFLVSILIPLLLAGCKSTPKENTEIRGMIFNAENEPVSNAQIFLDGKKITSSDIYGHFTLEKLVPFKEYSVLASKKGYEDSSIDFDYTNGSQIIYLRMYSSFELINLAENSVRQKNYSEAESFLSRAQKTGENTLSIKYLFAVINYYKKDYEKSLQYTDELIDEGYTDYYIYLLQVDSYQNGLNDPENAKLKLQAALDKKYDPETEKRLKDLNK